ncbi:AbrB family transcriptional regulator [Salinisphaera sp. Q1T1-3]|uniref:AbrB family transcriptional regulator n=1 Tax=Salinisphaera sp. Q1T1-3 TaxID=2321229 RepID=UPI000E72B553|nr:AbrB family transcriptional regulator [Salinisphaera sp. Q1T1-3]RJS94889.1 AbrB family transcriptional regulator [Salinisphaera sp. Q1T1-3]
MPQSLFRWTLLVILSAVLAVGLDWLHLPAAFLLGPMIAAIMVAVSFGPVHLPGLAFNWAQGVVGCLIARAITPSLLAEIGRDWPIFASGVLAVVLLSMVIGWLLTRWQVLPGPTAIWGTLPGAAAAMVIMAGDFGCDVGLVAFVQYVRVIIVSVLSAVVAAVFVPAAPAGGLSAHIAFLPSDWLGFGETVGFIVVASFLAVRLRIPAGPLMFVMVIGALLQNLHVLRIALPQILLIPGYCVLGWGIGMRFRRETLRQAMHALPSILLSTLLLLLACGGLAVVLVELTGMDPLTAYLATSPGGASTVAIIASASHLNVAYVMAMQVARAWFLMLTGPLIARTLSRWAGYPPGQGCSGSG